MYQYRGGALLRVVGFGPEPMCWRKKIRPSGCEPTPSASEGPSMPHDVVSIL
jgi:hypothetical protein